jgi:hypothetical protein
LVEGIWEKKGQELGLVNDATKKNDLTRIRGDRSPNFERWKTSKTRKKIDENQII